MPKSRTAQALLAVGWVAAATEPRIMREKTKPRFGLRASAE